MAKRNNKSNFTRAGRDVIAIANRSPLLPRSLTFRPLVSPVDLTVFEDRRTFHPERDQRPARSFSKALHRLVVKEPLRNPDRFASLRAFPASIPTRIGFEDPKRVLICVRRKRRKEVLHALKKTGRGGQKKPRRSWYSSISC